MIDYSPGLSLYPPLLEKQLRKLKESLKKSETQVELFPEVYTRLSGHWPDHSALLNSLAAVLNSKPEVRTFSSLTTEDYLLLKTEERGDIMYDETFLNNTVSQDRISLEFWPLLQTLRRRISRRMEMGVRQIIGHFLAYAVEIAQELFQDERLLVHTEVDVPMVEVPEIGRVRGPLEYVTCRAAGRLTMQKLMDDWDGADVKATKPFFICVEAKRWLMYGVEGSKAQLLAQLRALQVQGFPSDNIHSDQ